MTYTIRNDLENEPSVNKMAANRLPTNEITSSTTGTILRGVGVEAAPIVGQQVAPVSYPYSTPQMYHPMATMMLPGQMVRGVFQSSGSIYSTSVAPNLTAVQQQQGSERWYEEQQRLRERYAKERNYQIQQHRLREFQSSGSQLLNAEHLIQNMFGRNVECRQATKTTTQNNHRIADEQRDLRPAIQKARDWSHLGDLRDVFEVTSEELPPWCQEEALVPKLYTDVERYVTQNGIIDTSLLYPVLLSSGLSRETLGHIWTLANRKTLGMLTRSELYSILALVALAQNACQVTSLSILNSLHQAPVPLLNQTTTGVQETSRQTVNQNQITDDEFDDFQSASSDPNRTDADSVTKEINVGSRLANYGLVHSSNSGTQQTQPEPNSNSLSEDDFADFQHASVSELTAPIARHRSDTSSATAEITTTLFYDPITTTPRDLMSNDEDKYSVFRTLEATDSKETDDFNDFLSSDVPPPPPPPPPTSTNPIETTSATSNFANSSSSICQIKTKATEEESTDDEFEFMSYASRKPSSYHDPTNVEAIDNNDDDFGDFVAPGETNSFDSAPFKSAFDNLSLNFNFVKLKDKSSVESQSVSSLDFGTQIENNLSRCGSIPSLDFKLGSDNDQESRDSSPCCVSQSNVATSTTNGFGGGHNVESTINTLVSLNGRRSPFVDRYSVIRNDVPKECEWQRCLDSCYELIRNALNIFNGISSSTVCKEVIGSEEGENYLQNIIEVYRVSLRISASSKVSAETELESKIEDTLRDINEEWNNLSSFIVGSQIFPDESSFDFSSSVLDSDDDQNVQKACGVCLLEVKDHRSPSNSSDTQNKLLYGGRQYHAACANFWVNCVDSLLPALTFPKRQLS